MRKLMFALLVIAISATATFAQEPSASANTPQPPANTLEIRGSNPSIGYYYADLAHVTTKTWVGRAWMIDGILIKNPGSTELNFGAGPQFNFQALGTSDKPGSVTPLLYVVGDTQTGTLGLKIATLILAQHKRLKVQAYAFRNVDFRKELSSSVIDDANATMSLGKFDVGYSLGLFIQGPITDIANGEIVRWNLDKTKSVYCSIRPHNNGPIEIRFGGTWSF